MKALLVCSTAMGNGTGKIPVNLNITRRCWDYRTWYCRQAHKKTD